MPIPTYDQLMLPLLRGLADGEVHQLRDFYDRLADEFALTQDERTQILPSGQQRVIANRVGWARTYLKKAGLVTAVKRGYVQITPAGRALLGTNPLAIDLNTLEQYESFREFRDAKPVEQGSGQEAAVVDAKATPEEVMDAAYEKHRQELQGDLLDMLKSTNPFFFEKVVLTLLRAMGYGAATGRGLTTPKSGDGGIDGIIYEDRLGLDKVVVQAKRWEGTVGRQIVQAFVGSMDFHRSRKGVVLTTGQFSRDAAEYINRIEGKTVVLIDGEQLTSLMIDHGVGVTRTKSYELADLSQDFFSEDGT